RHLFTATPLLIIFVLFADFWSIAGINSSVIFLLFITISLLMILPSWMLSLIRSKSASNGFKSIVGTFTLVGTLARSNLVVSLINWASFVIPTPSAYWGKPGNIVAVLAAFNTFEPRGKSLITFRP